MVKINKIYTRSGDDGTTGLIGGSRTKKNCLRVNSYGDIDELNSFIGWARTLADESSIKDLSAQLALIQNELFDLGAYLATPQTEVANKTSIKDQSIKRLEGLIDKAVDNLPELKSFVLPGGSELNSALHICRTVCRRAERSLLDLADSEKICKNAIIYINRLSDFLFAAARQSSAIKNIPEFLWKPENP